MGADIAYVVPSKQPLDPIQMRQWAACTLDP
jgi:hypothetical protein